MDLPTCPACGQSVLEDDAQECPFCGAPLKGGSPAKPAAKPPVKPAAKVPPPVKAAEPAAPAGEKPIPAVKRPPPVKGKGGEESTIEADEASAASAVPVNPKQGGGRSLEVVCPMCETHGFVAPSARGKMLRCCNPACMVPIFPGPPVEKTEAPPPPPPKPKSKVPLYAGIAVAVIAIGAGAFFFLGGKEESGKLPPIAPYVPKAADPNAVDPDDPEAVAKAETKKKAEEANKTPKVKTREELLKQALEDLQQASQNTTAARKPYFRGVTSNAFAKAGDIQQAESVLERLGKEAGHQAVVPLVTIAWQHLAADRKNEFKKTLDAAVERAKSLPTRGRAAFMAAASLAAALAADGRHEAAQAMLASHRDRNAPAAESLAAALLVVQSDGTFNLDRTLTGRSLGDWQSPLEVGVTLALAARGRWDDGLNWAKKLTDASARSECTVVWAEALAVHALAANLPAEFDRAKGVGADLSPAGKARLLARLADVQLAKGDKAAAEALLKEAQTTLEAIAPPSPIKISNMRQLLEFKLPDAAPLREAALAAGEIAGVQLHLGQTEPGWTSVQRALAYLRGTAPSSGYMKAQDNDVVTRAEFVRLQLKGELNLKDDDTTRRRFNDYKTKCQELRAASIVRLRWSGALLLAAVQRGLLDPVRGEILNQTDLSVQESYFDLALPQVLALRYQEAGKTEQHDSLKGAAPKNVKIIDPALNAQETTARLIADGKIADAVKQINGSTGTGDVFDEWILRLSCRLTSAEKYDLVVQFLTGLKDTVVREDGLQLSAALATLGGNAEKFRARATEKVTAPAEAAALHAGLVDGLSRSAK